ncbi:MAG: iron-containing alcohol dehydrogenase [Firmicutes bacterium]|nr:iron-containing alcohol dehydrogenase [Bacillota bacterium]
MEYNQIFYPARFAVGQGSIKEIAAFAEKEGFSRALIVTDGGLVSSSVMAAVVNVLKEAGISYDVFSDVIPNPTVEIVDAAAAAYHKYNSEFIIAVGGGSPVDTAKAASLVAANGGSIRHYIGINMTVHPGVPVVAVNTTAGTGAEVTRFFVLTDHENHTKSITIDDHCLVALAISDPTLMVTLSPEMTAATAMDALTHAIEAYCAGTSNPFSDGLALRAIVLINRALPKVMRNPEDIAARTDLCWAASMAGYAFSNSGLGMMHSIGFSIENFCGIPHGQAVGMVMPYVMEFNRKEVCDRIADIGTAIGLNDHVTLGARTVRHFTKLLYALPIPTMKEAGITAEQIPALAKMAMNDPTLGFNPVQPTIEEMTSVIEWVYCEDFR